MKDLTNIDVSNYLINYVRRGCRIISEGDWDGILGTVLILLWLKSKGLKPSTRHVLFPHPSELPGMAIRRAILIELSPSRGYIAKEKCILIDHHEINGMAEVKGRRISKIVLETSEHMPSVTRLIINLLKLKNIPYNLTKLIEAVDLIDQGKSKNNTYAWNLHKAYLINIEDKKFRYKVLKHLVRYEFEKLNKLVLNEAKAYDKAKSEKYKVLIERTNIYSNERIATTYYMVSDRFEKAIFREVMLDLEKRHDIVVVLAVKDDSTLEKVHIATQDDKIDIRTLIAKILRNLRYKGIIGGGKEKAGSIQFPILTLRFKNAEKLIDIIVHNLD